MPFVRSAASFPDLAACAKTYREQLNLVSAHIDASNVYGSSEEDARALRAFSGGLMLSSEGKGASLALLPTDNRYILKKQKNSFILLLVLFQKSQSLLFWEY